MPQTQEGLVLRNSGKQDLKASKRLPSAAFCVSALWSFIPHGENVAAPRLTEHGGLLVSQSLTVFLFGPAWISSLSTLVGGGEGGEIES